MPALPPISAASHHTLLHDARDFVRCHAIGIVASFAFMLIGYGMKMFGNTYSIDTQAIIDVPELQYDAWYSLDRFGLMALKRALGLYWYNNSLASILTPLLFFTAVWLWAFLLHRTWTFSFAFRPLAFVLPALSAPIFAEQLGFLLQGIEIALCFNALVLATILIFESADQSRSRSVLYLLGATLLCALAFSCYLAMTTVFVLIVASGLFTRSAPDTSRRLGFTFLTSIGVFTLSFVIYKVLNAIVQARLNIDTNAYIDDQSRWGKDPFFGILGNIAYHGFRMLVGRGIFYTGFLGIVIILFLTAIVFALLKKKATWITGGLALCICAAPLLMVVILGGHTAYRTELTYPLALALMTAFLVSYTEPKRLIAVPLSLGILAISLQGIYNVNRLYYTEATVYAQDVTLANTIYERAITQKADPSTPLRIVFIGSHTHAGNKSTFARDDLELIGVSIFSISFSTNHGTYNMVQFMHNQGIPVMNPTSDDISEAEHQAQSMPHWPATGSVQVHGDLAIVNF